MEDLLCLLRVEALRLARNVGELLALGRLIGSCNYLISDHNEGSGSWCLRECVVRNSFSV